MPILVDTGASVQEYQKHMRFPLENFVSVEDALASQGLRPEDIGLVICSHLHYDHCLNLERCTKARIVVQKAELEFSRCPHPIFAESIHTTLWQQVPFEVIDGDTEILPGIRLYLLGGHTPGSQAIGVRTERGQVVISGVCTTPDNFNPPPEVTRLPVLACGTHIDLFQAYEAVLKIKRLADIIFPAHDYRLLEHK